jgi:hypothetical protein
VEQQGQLDFGLRRNRNVAAHRCYVMRQQIAIKPNQKIELLGNSYENQIPEQVRTAAKFQAAAGISDATQSQK